jgi:imidazolonepropionase-like amidohydrolase
MPGIVAVDTDLAAARDSQYSTAPDVMAVDGFDFEAPLRDALEGGVTTAYLSPGRDRLIGGQGAVIKTAGRDLVQRVLVEGQCLRINLDESGTRAPRVFEPTPHPTDDDPLLPSRVQGPTARIGVLAELRTLFAAARTQDGLQGPGGSENHFDSAPLRAVLGGKLPLRAAAWQAQDIRRALLLQKEFATRMVLENPQEIGPLAVLAHEQDIAAVFRVPVLLGQANPGGEDRALKVPQPHFEAPARAAAAGMPIGLAPAAGVPLRDYLVAVALCVRHGLPPAQALRAVGQDAGRILSVDQRVGRLAPGLDADFVVLSGDPLAIGTMVESTWIDGRCEYRRALAEQLLAVRCGRILDGTGQVLRGGVLIAQGSRIKAVGAELAIPYGARLVDVPDAVMTPGFVDAWSHLGLSGQGTGVPAGLPNQLLDQAIAHDDPMFEPALAAGVTTLLVAGTDGALVSGRITAVKTGAVDHDSMVVRAICGQRVVFDAIGPDSEAPLREALDRGKKYADTWAAYDKALAEHKAGKKPSAPAPAVVTPAAPAAPDPITGTWEASLDIQGRFQIKVLLDLELQGTKVTGKVRLTMGSRELPSQDIESGSFENGHLKLEFRGMGGSATIEGNVKDDTFEGTVALGPMGDQPISAKRIAKQPGGAPAPTSSATAADAASDGPKRPDVDQGLEPLRAVFEGRGALVVRVRRGAAVRSVMALLTPLKVPLLLQDPDGVLDDPALLGGAQPTVLLEPDVVQTEGARIVNDAARYADLPLPIAFGTGDCAGARFLPLHAAYAVRYGLGPDDALKALTSNAARAFKLDERVGQLKKGADADFVVFSGDPFEPTSRVLLVGCNGRIAVDNREVQK